MPILPKSRTQREISAVLEALEVAIRAETLEASRMAVETAMKRLKRHGARLDSAASKLGAKGGRKTAERGPEYFARIAAMRKTRAGGRPRKTE